MEHSRLIPLLAILGAVAAAILAVIFWQTTTERDAGGSRLAPRMKVVAGLPSPSASEKTGSFRPSTFPGPLGQSLEPILAPIFKPVVNELGLGEGEGSLPGDDKDAPAGLVAEYEDNQDTPSPAYSFGEPNPALSEEQIFEILWPQSYRDALVILQDLMVNDGFITGSEKISPITSDDDVYAALFKIAAYAEKQGWVGSADTEQLRRGIQELARIINVEREALRINGKISSGVVLPGGQRLNETPLSRQSFFSMIIDGLKYSLTVNAAHAQIPGGGNWVTSPDCYKDLSPTNPTPGVDLWAFCCNCGCRYVLYTCVFVPDCGPYSRGCDVPFGCLNLVCGGWPNAIWDQFSYPLGTGICGCG